MASSASPVKTPSREMDNGETKRVLAKTDKKLKPARIIVQCDVSMKFHLDTIMLIQLGSKKRLMVHSQLMEKCSSYIRKEVAKRRDMALPSNKGRSVQEVEITADSSASSSTDKKEKEEKEIQMVPMTIHVPLELSDPEKFLAASGVSKHDFMASFSDNDRDGESKSTVATAVFTGGEVDYLRLCDDDPVDIEMTTLLLEAFYQRTFVVPDEITVMKWARLLSVAVKLGAPLEIIANIARVGKELISVDHLPTFVEIAMRLGETIDEMLAIDRRYTTEHAIAKKNVKDVKKNAQQLKEEENKDEVSGSDNDEEGEEDTVADNKIEIPDRNDGDDSFCSWVLNFCRCHLSAACASTMSVDMINWIVTNCVYFGPNSPSLSLSDLLLYIKAYTEAKKVDPRLLHTAFVERFVITDGSWLIRCTQWVCFVSSELIPM